MTTIVVKHEVELNKVVAAVRLGLRRVNFQVANELVDPLLARLEATLRDANVRAVLEVIDPDGETVVTYVLVGAAAGAGLGLMVAGPGGAIAGALVGAAAGFAAAHIQVRIETNANSPTSTVSLVRDPA